LSFLNSCFSTANKLLIASTTLSLNPPYSIPSTSFERELSNPCTPPTGYSPDFNTSPVGSLSFNSGKSFAMASTVSQLQKLPATTKNLLSATDAAGRSTQSTRGSAISRTLTKRWFPVGGQLPLKIAQKRCSEVFRLSSEVRYSRCAKGPRTNGGLQTDSVKFGCLLVDEIPNRLLC
jgi:hypothetical protein